MLNQREEKTGTELSNHGACNLVKWSDFFPVCGKIVVKRKITAKLAVIFLVSSLNRMKAGEIRAERQKPRESCDSRGLKIPKQ